MVIRLLGTGAAEGIPAFYSDTDVSQYARLHGGKDVRSRAGAIIDNCLKIDFPPDTLSQMHRDQLDARDWLAIAFTHSDDDHFCLHELQYALHPFSSLECAPFTIYANETICALTREAYPDWPFDLVSTRSFQSYPLAEYTLTPIHAKHKADEDAHNLIISCAGKSILYATDTGIWEEPTWKFLEQVSLDCLVIECTSGVVLSDYDGHLNVASCIEVVGRLRSQGTLGANAPVWTTHHSHNGGATHEKLMQILNPHEIQVGFDGLEIEV